MAILSGRLTAVVFLMLQIIVKEIFMKKLLSAITDKNGKLSMMRLLIAFIVITYMITWSRLCIAEGNLIPIDWQQAAVIVGSLFAKAHQSSHE